MSSTALPAGPGPGPTRWWNGGALVLLGLAVLYVPTYWSAAGSLWQSDDHAHGPIILAVAAWLFWRERSAWQALPARADSGFGWAALLLGLACYLTGRAFDSSVFVFGSQPLVVAGAVLLTAGRPGLRQVGFAVVYLLFMVPLPGVLVDAATGPLKQWISVIAESVLYAAGYPIARSGVVISIGQYQMLVADACSGLHSMFSLAALGTLFIHLAGHPGRGHRLLMLAAVLPIAFVANVVRVMALILVTYHFGDEAGQGFLHGAAGVVLMLTALAGFFLLDATLARLVSARTPRQAARG